MESNEQNSEMYEDEIDLANIMRKIWVGRITILITTAIFIAIAGMYLLYGSYTRIKEYESQATLMVESPSVDSLITVVKSPLFIAEVLKIKLVGLKSGAHSVLEVLDQQTIPSQGNLSALTDRINGIKGNTGILVVTVMMQDKLIAKQLADSVVQKLTPFLIETQLKRIQKQQKILVDDTLRNFQILRNGSLINLQYLSKGNSNNVQFLTEGTAKEIQFISNSAVKNIQYQSEISEKNIQFLTEGYLKAESTYLQSQKTLADFYSQNSKNLERIDSIEVKRLNADIKLKYNVYSTLYQQLEQAKIEAKKQLDSIKIDAEKQLYLAKINAEKQLDQAKLDAKKQMEQSKIDAEKQLQQTQADADNQIGKIKIDIEKQAPVISILETATSATQVNVQKAKKIVLAMLFLGIIAGIGIVLGKKYYFKKFVQVAGQRDTSNK